MAGAGGARSPETVPIPSCLLELSLAISCACGDIGRPAAGPLAAPSRLDLEIRAAPDSDPAGLLPVRDHGGLRGCVQARTQIARPRRAGGSRGQPGPPQLPLILTD